MSSPMARPETTAGSPTRRIPGSGSSATSTTARARPSPSRSLFAEIGGFDRRYLPAYYEDADLAFEVRSRGLRVVYQPASRVVHTEGVTWVVTPVEV